MVDPQLKLSLFSMFFLFELLQDSNTIIPNPNSCFSIFIYIILLHFFFVYPLQNWVYWAVLKCLLLLLHKLHSNADTHDVIFSIQHYGCLLLFFVSLLL
ncbi:hypothetical protein D3C72_1866690 [compost metagenome]